MLRVSEQCIQYPMTRLEQLVAMGHTLGEAEVVLRLAAVACAQRDDALRTGRCECGGAFSRYLGRLECRNCDAVHAA